MRLSLNVIFGLLTVKVNDYPPKYRIAASREGDRERGGREKGGGGGRGGGEKKNREIERDRERV